MKRIFTLMAGLILTVAAMAADRSPDLTVRSSRNFKIVIDGRAFYSNSSVMHFDRISRGNHYIQVFEMKSGFFGQRERMVNSTSFRIGRDDVRINIDYAGRIDVRNDYDRNSGWGMNDRDNNWGNNDRQYDQRNDQPDPRNNDHRSDNRNGDYRRN